MLQRTSRSYILKVQFDREIFCSVIVCYSPTPTSGQRTGKQPKDLREREGEKERKKMYMSGKLQPH
jgi:hypothetical protein